MSVRDVKRDCMTIPEKLGQVSWGLILVLGLVASVGFAMQYSAANGNWQPWTLPQMARFGVGIAALIAIAMVDVRFWHRHAYLVYAVAIVLLVIVDFFGTVGMGAQRWLDLYVIQVQPSEVAKIALILALARHFHALQAEDVVRFWPLLVPAGLVLLPAALVMKQPDLGTAAMLLASAGVIFFVAGVRLRWFAIAIVLVLASLPLGWKMMHDYQHDRILTYLDPERDPLGTGYHILQSKIALGAGGLFGKGFMEGTQSHLSFLPERQTDFIFTMLAEEFGLVGGVGLMLLYGLVVAFGYAISLRSASQFGRLLGLGLTSVFFLYVLINIAMVTGLVPVVGVPLPLVSYGGTSMMTLLFGFGLMMSVHVHRDVPVPRRPGGHATN
ncbi:MAG: rod shape-determining protein RodA [Alphaproteobacteria bacterium]|nr:rod shape-determining protein RodA [Alphaproteobacteria bacterium]